MFMGGFLAVWLVLVDTTLLQKPSQLSLFLAKVLMWTTYDVYELGVTHHNIVDNLTN